jgi:ribonuclease I
VVEFGSWSPIWCEKVRERKRKQELVEEAVSLTI